MKRERSPLLDAAGRSALRTARDWSSYVDSLSHVSVQKGEAFHVAVVGSRDDLIEVLSSPQDAPFGVSRIRLSDQIGMFTYSRASGHEQQCRVSGEFAVARTVSNHVFLFCFLSEASFWRDGVRRLVDYMYPKASFPFLTQSEMLHLLKDIDDGKQDASLRILESSSKRRLGSGARKRFRSEREWTDSPYQQVFAEARERNEWFRSVRFDFVSETGDRGTKSLGTKAILSKYGYFSCSSDFPFFSRNLLPSLISMASKRLEFFSDRDRRSTPSKSPRTLEVTYDQDLFAEGKIQILVQTLRKFPNGRCTILHGNPYLHASIVDNRDFSSVDLWVLSANRILIVPQVRTSEPALKRLVNHIFENFREGALSDYTPD